MAIKYLSGKRISASSSDIVTPTLGSTADGTITGATLDTTNQKLGTGCLSFDGTDDYVENSSTNLFGSSWDKFSIVGWVKPDDSTTAEYILGTTARDGNTNNFNFLQQRADGKFQGTIGDDSTQVTMNSTTTYSAGTWYHLALVYDGSASTKCKLYVNGSLEASSTSGATSYSVGTKLSIGRQGTSGQTFFDGAVDDVAYFKRVLTATEISALYNSGTGAVVSSLTDQSGIKAYYSLNSTTSSYSSSGSHSSSGSESIPTSNNGGSKVSVDAGTTFKDFKMQFTLSMTHGSGNWNGAVIGYVSAEDVPCNTNSSAFIGVQRHRHNSGSSESEHASHELGNSSLSSPNSNGNARAPNSIIDIGTSSGFDYGTGNYEIERSGSTAYFRKYGNGFGSAATSTDSWTTNTAPLRYFIFSGRWQGHITASTTNRDYEWTGLVNNISNEAPTDMITNVPTGSIIEESDTGKHKIWNATTSTWTEVS